MKIQRYIKKDNKRYKLVKIYTNYALYKNRYGVRECFTFHELGLLTEQVKPPKTNVNPEKVIFL